MDKRNLPFIVTPKNEEKLENANENPKSAQDLQVVLDVANKIVDDIFDKSFGSPGHKLPVKILVVQPSEESKRPPVETADMVQSGITIASFHRGKKREVVDNEKIDRLKLIQAHKDVFIEKGKEVRKNALLYRKLVEYFRRKKANRALQEDDPEIATELKRKYRSSLLKLFEMQSSQAALKNESEVKLGALHKEKEQISEECSMNVCEFNELLKEVGLAALHSETGQQLPEKVVDRWIRKVTALRKQVSETRLELIKTQDLMASLSMRAKRLEDLGNGLRMIDFEQLRAEAQSLRDKIEERNNDLAKLRYRCNSDNNILAHVREKQFILGNTIILQQDVLSELEDELTLHRNHLNSLKVEREELRKEYQRISFESGLLDKPLLLHDYDSTMEDIENMKQKIELLRKEKQQVENELTKYDPTGKSGVDLY